MAPPSAESAGPLAGTCRLDPVELARVPGGRVAVRTAGPDAVFELLLRGDVSAVVPAGPDLRSVRLLVLAIGALPPASVRELWGLGAGGRRVWFYHHLRERLPADDRAWWDAREERVRLGLADQGDRERAVAAAGRWLKVGGPVWARGDPWRAGLLRRWRSDRGLVVDGRLRRPAWTWSTDPGQVLLRERLGRIGAPGQPVEHVVDDGDGWTLGWHAA